MINANGQQIDYGLGCGRDSELSRDGAVVRVAVERHPAAGCFTAGEREHHHVPCPDCDSQQALGLTLLPFTRNREEPTMDGRATEFR